MTDERFVIWSIEHSAWWRPNWLGYCETLTEAGVYSKEEADEILARANVVAVEECAIPITALEGTGMLALRAYVESR